MSAGVMRRMVIAGMILMAVFFTNCASTREMTRAAGSGSSPGKDASAVAAGEAGTPGALNGNADGPERRSDAAVLAMGDGARAPDAGGTDADGDEVSVTAVNARIEDVESWQLAGPFPQLVGEVSRHAANSWEEVLQGVADSKPGLVVMSEAMSCAARELGRFYLAHQAQPTDELRQFVLARCGATPASVSIAYLAAEAPKSMSEEQIFAEWQEQLPALIETHLGSGSRAAGVWFGREGERVLLLLASGERRVHVRPTPLVPDREGNVVIEGELLVPAARLHAMMTEGRLGVAECEVDSSVALPRFSIQCPVAETGQPAWIQLESYPSGRLLPSTALNALVWPSRKASKLYERPHYGESREVGTDPAAVTLELLRLLNDTRVAAGMVPVELAEQESKLAVEAAPHYFGAVAGLLPEIMADAVMLVLEEGSQLEEEVKSSSFAAGVVTYSVDPSRLLAAMLERPSSRKALLDPALRQVAIGPVIFQEEKMIAVIFVSYATGGKERREVGAELKLPMVENGWGEGEATDVLKRRGQWSSE